MLHITKSLTALALGSAVAFAPVMAPKAQAQDVENVVLGMLPISTLIPVFIAQENGWFAEEGLSVEFQPEVGGVDVITSVIAGDMDFGYSNQTSLLIARQRGVGIHAIANGFEGETDDLTGNNAIVVRPDSRIETLADLRGKRVSSNVLNNLVHLLFMEALANDGVDDPNTEVEFIEVPFPDVAPAVLQGTVDAGWAVEPFVQIALNQGLEVLAFPVYEADPDGLMFSAFFTSGQMVRERPEVVEAFVRVIYRGQQFAIDNPDEVRAAFPRFNPNISEEIANNFMLPVWNPSLSADDFRSGAEMAVKYGFLDEIPDLEEFVWTGQ